MENTKLGKVLFSDGRREKLQQLVLDIQDGEAENPFSELAKSGIAPDDLPRFFAGESGYAVLIDEPRGQTPRAFGVGWVEPGADLAQKAVEALGRAIENQKEDDHPPQRIDLNIDGQSVMQITVPAIHVEYGELKLPDGIENLSEEEREKAWDEAFERHQKGARSSVRFHTFLVSVLGDRLLVAHTVADSSEEEREEIGARLEAVYARLVAAHDDEPGPFVPRIAATRGMDSVFDSHGVAVMEAVGNAASLLKLIRAGEGFQADPDGEKIMRVAGADQLGPFALRMTLDGSLLRTGIFLSVPEPRRGLLRLLEQSPLPAEPPAWVPAKAMSFSHFSFDFGQAYGIIKEEVIKEFGEQASKAFDVADLQARNFAQLDVRQLLKSLGNRQYSVSFEPRIVHHNVADELGIDIPQDRMAVVWEVKDEDVWLGLMKHSARFTALVPGVEETDEQGFHGWRLQNEGIEGGFVVGKGYLVLAIGQGVLETMLSSLNNPPTGRDALRESETYRRASSLLELGPAVGFELTDSDRYVRAAMAAFESLFSDLDDFAAELDGEAAGGGEMAWLRALRALIPDDSEMENIFGVTVSDFQVTRDGLLVRSFNEFPSD